MPDAERFAEWLERIRQIHADANSQTLPARPELSRLQDQADRGDRMSDIDRLEHDTGAAERHTAPRVDPTVKVARDLTEILDLSTDLEAQAEARHDDPDMPGGTAMAMLGPVGNAEAAEYRYEHATQAWYDDPTTTRADYPELYEDPDWEPPLQTLLWWSDSWREERGNITDMAQTIVTEAGYLRQILGWAYETEPRWDDFATDIRKARVRLENVLYAGNRAERTQVPCKWDDCEDRPRLIRIYRRDPDRDGYKCPACKRFYTQTDFIAAQKLHMASEGAERWVPLRVALTGLDRPERTIRKWVGDCLVHTYCEVVTRRVWVWWPDVRRLDLSTPRRTRTRTP